MSERAKWTIFVAFFLSIILLMNYFITYSFFSILSLHKGTGFHILTISLATSYILAMFLEKSYPNNITKAFYILSSVWLGAMLLLLSMLIIYYPLRYLFSIPQEASGIIMLSITTAIVIYGIIHSRNIKVRKHTLEFSKSRLGKDVRIVHISDIHLGTINQKPFLQSIVDKVNSLNPDCVMLTGDLVDGSAPITLDMLSPLKKARAPIFYVIGNHEIYDGLDFVMPILKKTKLTILRNQIKSWNGLQIAGIDFTDDKKQAAEDIKGLKIRKSKMAVLLNHEPIAFEEAVAAGFDLQLSGHTHKGQLFPFTLAVKAAYKYYAGLFKLNDSYINVSQGTGTWGPPMRILTDSEICVLDLKRT